jgi:hypothetical protein
MLWLITCITFIATLSMPSLRAKSTLRPGFRALPVALLRSRKKRVSRTGRGIASGTAWRALENFSPRHRRKVLLAPSC